MATADKYPRAGVDLSPGIALGDLGPTITTQPRAGGGGGDPPPDPKGAIYRPAISFWIRRMRGARCTCYLLCPALSWFCPALSCFALVLSCFALLCPGFVLLGPGLDLLCPAWSGFGTRCLPRPSRPLTARHPTGGRARPSTRARAKVKRSGASVTPAYMKFVSDLPTV